MLAREALGSRRWACVVEAPFDMSADASDLIGNRMSFAGQAVEVRGIVHKLPAGMIVAGELIELLVVETFT